MSNYSQKGVSDHLHSKKLTVLSEFLLCYQFKFKIKDRLL